MLELLASEDALTTSEIAEETGVSPSWVRDLVSRARGNGYITSEGGGFQPGQGVSPKEHALTDRGRDHLAYLRAGDASEGN